jgi:hypothetical protein
VADLPRSTFDLDQVIAARLDGEPGDHTHLQALAVLFDADLTDAERAEAFGAVMAALLAQLSPCELDRFRQIAVGEGEAAAMSYLGTVTRPASRADQT